MNDVNETIEVEIVYDPSTHREKLRKIGECTSTLKNAKAGNTTMVFDLMGIFPKLKEAECLIEYFEVLRKHGANFGVIVSKDTIKELKDLQEAVDVIRSAATREFNKCRTSRWNSSGR